MDMPELIKQIEGLQILVVKIPPKRLSLLDSCAEEDPECLFAEPVPWFDISRNKTLVALIIDDSSQIIRAAIGQRGYSAGTGLSQVHLSHTVKIENLSAKILPNTVDTRFKSRVETVIRDFGLLSPGASRSLLMQLVTLAPGILSVIQTANHYKRSPLSILSEQQQLRLQQECDAALTAMLIAGINRDAIFQNQSLEKPESSWFLDLVTEPRLREDPMLYNDLSTFPGFQKFQNHVSGAVRFRQNETVLTVLLVNRQPLEELTGTDLIYYNESYRAFVLVQYKAMEKDGEDFIYRLPNSDLNKEIERMKEVIATLKNKENPLAGHDYRLNTGAFYLKFCPRKIPQTAQPELIPGMYFPLEHWQILDGNGELVGDRGGKVLKMGNGSPPSNTSRYLNNSDFATLVGKAWIGTTSAQSEILEAVIQNTLQSGRSVTFAKEAKVTR
ncbi:MAG: hypothetical protein ACO1QS_02680 [Verrucomicrobiota bacterium]